VNAPVALWFQFRHLWRRVTEQQRWPANTRMYHALPLLIIATALVGCQRYVDSTPSTVVEGNNPTNYVQIFDAPVPSDVTVVNSRVVTYSFRPGVVTTDDFEFELLVPSSWIQKATKSFYLRRSDGEFVRTELDSRRARARPWYAPKLFKQYDFYRDATSVGYVHMLVQKEGETDGRHRVFISKH
jgi:hypothetical protein